MKERQPLQDLKETASFIIARNKYDEIPPIIRAFISAVQRRSKSSVTLPNST